MSAHRLHRILVIVCGLMLATAFAPTQAEDVAVLSHAELAHASGEQIYQHVCQGCHMADGRGANGAGTYPALRENPTLASAQYAAAVVLQGRRNMPAFVERPDLKGFEATVYLGLSDAQIADVVNHVRTHFDNHYDDPITASAVSALHADQKETP